MSKIYIVQDQLSKDPKTGEWKRRFPQVDELAEMGEIVYVIDQRVNSFDTAKALDDIHTRLDDITEDDHLVLIGTSLLCSMAFAFVAHRLNGEVNILQWSTREHRYLKMPLRIF